MTAPTRLYMVPTGETAYASLADCYEAEIDPYVDDEFNVRPADAAVIEEWTVRPPREHLPSVDHLLYWIGERVEEVDDDWPDHFTHVEQHPAVREAADALLDAIARRITYRMADEKVRDIAITWDADGRPLADGQPLDGHGQAQA